MRTRSKAQKGILPANMKEAEERLKVSRAIVVEGRDDVFAVSRACDALIIPTHGYGISPETWALIEKAYKEKGLIILTDPDHAGERIRKRITERFPGSVQCYLARRDALRGQDIGVENAAPDIIREAVVIALENADRTSSPRNDAEADPVSPADLLRLGLSGAAGAAELRAETCRELGIGYSNAKAMISKLKGFGIGRDELEKTVVRIKKQ